MTETILFLLQQSEEEAERTAETIERWARVDTASTDPFASEMREVAARLRHNAAVRRRAREGATLTASLGNVQPATVGAPAQFTAALARMILSFFAVEEVSRLCAYGTIPVARESINWGQSPAGISIDVAEAWVRSTTRADIAYRLVTERPRRKPEVDALLALP
jgi:hypothetical protein